MSAAAAFAPLLETAAPKRRMNDAAYKPARACAQVVVDGFDSRLYEFYGKKPARLEAKELVDCIAFKLTLGALNTIIGQKELAKLVKLEYPTVRRRLADLVKLGVVGRKKWRTKNAYWIVGLGAPPVPRKRRYWSHLHLVAPITAPAAPPPVIAPIEVPAPGSHLLNLNREVNNSLSSIRAESNIVDGWSMQLLRDGNEVGFQPKWLLRAMVEAIPLRYRMHVARRWKEQFARSDRNLAGHFRWHLKHWKKIVSDYEKGSPVGYHDRGLTNRQEYAERQARMESEYRQGAHDILANRNAATEAGWTDADREWARKWLDEHPPASAEILQNGNLVGLKTPLNKAKIEPHDG